MSSELTNQTMVVVSRLGDFWVTSQQAQHIIEVKAANSNAILELDGNLLAAGAIDGILTAETYGTLNTRRRGGWQCRWQYWHERGQECAHSQIPPRK